MAFQSCPKIVEVAIHALYGGVTIANILHVQTPSAYTDADLQNIADATDQKVGDHYLAFCDPGVQYIETVAKGLELQNDKIAVSADNTGPGTMTGGASLPANVSLCITLRSAYTGKSARGRFYAFPASVSALQAVNTATAQYAAGIVDFLTYFAQGINGLGFAWVVLSRQNNKAIRPVGIGYTITDYVNRNLTFDSQRGRLPRAH